MRIRQPRTTALIFNNGLHFLKWGEFNEFLSGKIVCTGAKCVNLCFFKDYFLGPKNRVALRHGNSLAFCKNLATTCISANSRCRTWWAPVMLASKFAFMVCLPLGFLWFFFVALQLTHDQFTTYEPELFPGLVYRMIKVSQEIF